MNISQNGLNFIKKQEGLRLEKYLDAEGNPTIGYGHTISPNERYNKISLEIAQQLLQSDISRIEYVINTAVKVELTQSQFDALVSLIYNWGSGNFRRSQGLLKLNRGDFKGAKTEFFEDPKLMGIKDPKSPSKTILLKDLIDRRAAEEKLFDNAA
jgi:lysozyme